MSVWSGKHRLCCPGAVPVSRLSGQRHRIVGFPAPMRDPYLTAIIQSVERGGDPVMISIALNSGAIATGFVRQSR